MKAAKGRANNMAEGRGWPKATQWSLGIASEYWEKLGED